MEVCALSSELCSFRRSFWRRHLISNPRRLSASSLILNTARLTEVKPAMDEDIYLAPGEAARLLSLSPARVRQLVDEGQLAALRTGSGLRLIRKSEVERLVERRRLRTANLE